MKWNYQASSNKRHTSKENKKRVEASTLMEFRVHEKFSGKFSEPASTFIVYAFLILIQGGAVRFLEG